MTLAKLIIIRVIAQPPFNIKLITFVDILLHNLGKLSIEQKVMPIGMVRYLRPILSRIATLRGSECHSCHGLVCIIIMNIWVFTHVADKHHLIHST